MLQADPLQHLICYLMKTAASSSTSVHPGIDRNAIRAPRSGQFHILSKALTARDIEKVFDRIVCELREVPIEPAALRQTSKASPWKNIRGYQVKSTEAVLIQPFMRTPLVLPDTGNKEGRYAYLLLLQIEVHDGKPANSARYLFSQRELAADPMEHGLRPYCSEIGTPAFLDQFLSPRHHGGSSDSRIERLNMRMMASSRGEIRRKIIEAHDVASATSSLGLHRAIAGSMTLSVPSAAKSRLVAVSPHRQRIRSGSTRVSLDDVVEWACECATGFYKVRTTSTISSSFIAQMAQPLDQLTNKTPSSILIERGSLLKELDAHFNETGQSWHPTSSTPTGWTLDDVLDALNEPLVLENTPVDKSGKPLPLPLATTPSEVFYKPARALLGFDKKDHAVRLRVTSRTCSVELPQGVGFLGTSSTDESGISLAEFINKRKTFRVVFDSGQALYCSEGAYRTSNLNLATRQLLQIFHPVSSLANVHTEKGEVNTSDTAFKNTSSFYWIEKDGKITHPDSMLICDDASVEWCDYLEIDATKPRMRWLHAKVQQIELASDRAARIEAKKKSVVLPKKTQPVHTSPSLSASDLEEVVGQAIKNLSRLRLLSSDQDFVNRKAVWENQTCSLPAPASIARLRRRGTPAIMDIGKKFDETAAHPFALYEVGIVVPNYSLNVLAREFNNIGTQPVSQSVLQAFWLLSGFMHACLEVGAHPMVFVHD